MTAPAPAPAPSMEPPSGQPQTHFTIAVDSDHKATEFRPLSISSPHMRAFHLAWLSLFSCFFSTFSIPPLLPIIRQDLHLTDADVGYAGIASFAGSIFSRLTMGPACDLLGPRIASASLSLFTAPVVLSTSLISTPQSFIFLRFLIGFSLANFVSSQFWMSSMFSSSVVDRTCQRSRSRVGQCRVRLHVPSVTAWRVAYVLPATFQAVMAVMVLAFGQDLPDRKYKRSRITGSKDKDNFFEVLFHGLTNYRGWILGLTYGFCFGVELTTDNIIAQYFYNRFNVNIQTAGAIAASFGVANCVSRPAGGILSDKMGRRFGMRGRLWSLWVVQNVAGLLSVLLGRVNSLVGSVIVMCSFSLFVQAASGLTFGVVPFVSKRSLGVISGMTGSGGTVGAVVTQLLLFSGSNTFSTEKGISLMGLMMLISTLPLTFIYFPQWGGTFCRPSVQPDFCHGDYHMIP
ncbi:hypothetical protein RJ639_036301 [Escallonia herrerae]|uniref:High affinity nitrate transporter 2.7 n=1 Tax=Escallonia herrerae TaxID=1293975 RepID=A0AA89BCJ5_9ASTE|nr:hypothetical protein RJ639_036301 [Escallonia herrerae]